jgi:hypothetical protein
MAAADKQKARIGILLILCLGLLVRTVSAWEMDVLQKTLKEKGATWVAGETSLSHLTQEEFKQMLGFQPSLQGGPALMLPEQPKSAVLYTLPASIDWRSNNGGNWVSPVKDQQECGSCYAFATLATLETLIKFDQNDPLFDTDLSEQYLVSCGPWGNRNGYDYGGCLGNYSDYVGDFLMFVGVPDEDCFPYDENQLIGIEPLCDGACSDWMSRVTTITGWSYIAPQATLYLPHPDAIKEVLVNKPVPCGMNIYEDFKNYVGGVYEPLTGQENLGGHLVCIIGYDDSQSCWIVKNSWGSHWGENGFFRISYNETAINALTQFGIEALDVGYGDAVTTSTTTTTGPVTSTTTTGPTTSTTTSIGSHAKPNVVPCTPPGWTYPVVPASKQGTTVFNLSGDVLYPTPQKTYIDFALCNESDVPVEESFSVAFFIDDVEMFTATVEADLAGNASRVWLDQPFSLYKGQHILRLMVDVHDDVLEEDEIDNSFSIGFNWDGAVWPRLYGNMLGDSPAANIRLLRDFRDMVLITSPTGQRYVEVLYQYSFEIALLLLNDGALRVRTARVIEDVLPHLPPMLEGREVVLSSHTIAAFETLLDSFAAKAQPGMKAALGRVKKGVHAREIFDELGIAVR